MSEFDRYGGGEYERALEHAISIGGQDAGFYNEVKAKRLIDLARRRLGDPSTLSVLDVGAGIGLMDEHLTSTFGRVVGLDVSQQMVERAAERNPDAEYVAYDGVTFPFESGAFDIVFASCVFHHVVQEERARLAAEMARVTREGGIVTILEHNPLNPATRLVVSRCVRRGRDPARTAGVRASARPCGALAGREGVHPLLPVSERLRAAARTSAAGCAVLRRELAVDRVVLARGLVPREKGRARRA